MVSDSFYRESVPTASEGLEDRLVDTSSWKHEVKDLHAVMYIARMVHLAHEHGSEALLRVGVEIATCKHSRQCLWWHDFWYSDHEKREWFRKMVHQKLILAIKNLKGIMFEEPVKEEETDEVKKMRLDAQEANAALNAARSQQQNAELQCREAKERLAEAEAQMAELQKVIEHLKQRLVEAGNSPPRSVANVGCQADLQPPPAAKPPQVERGTEPDLALAAPAPAEPPQKRGPAEEAPRKEANSGANSRLAQMAQRIQELEAALRRAEEKAKDAEERRPSEPAVAAEVPVAPAKPDTGQVSAPKPAGSTGRVARPAAPDSGKEKPLPAAADPGLKRQVKELTEKLAQMAQRIQELEAALRRAEEKAIEAEGQLSAAEERASAAEGRRRSAEERAQEEARARRASEVALQRFQQDKPSKPVEPEKPVQPQGLSQEELEELMELRKLKAKYEKLEAKLRKREEELAATREELKALEEKHLRMLEVLKLVREQLRKVKEIAERKGLGKHLTDAFGESGLAATLESDEFTCFDRLYADALRRMEKYKEWASLRMAHGAAQKFMEVVRRPSTSQDVPPDADARSGEAGRWVWVPKVGLSGQGIRPPGAAQAPPGSASRSTTARSTSREPSEATAVSGMLEPEAFSIATIRTPLVQQSATGVFKGTTAFLARALSKQSSQTLSVHSSQGSTALKSESSTTLKPEGGATLRPEQFGGSAGGGTAAPSEPPRGAAPASNAGAMWRSASESGLQHLSQGATGSWQQTTGGSAGLRSSSSSGPKDSKPGTPLQKYLSDLFEASPRSGASVPSASASPKRLQASGGVCKGFSHLSPLLFQGDSPKKAEKPKRAEMLHARGRTRPRSSGSSKDLSVSSVVLTLASRDSGGVHKAAARSRSRAEASRPISAGGHGPHAAHHRSAPIVTTTLGPR